MLQSLIARRTGLMATRTVQRPQRYVIYVLFHFGMILMAARRTPHAIHKFMQSDVLFHFAAARTSLSHIPLALYHYYKYYLQKEDGWWCIRR